MKIIVFGATGRVGQLFVQQAIEKGYKVTAFVRTPEKMTIQGVHIIQGDAFDKEKVAEAIVGHDIVVSCLGSTKGPNKDTSIQRMVSNIVDGMEAANVKRIIYCASAGVFGEIPGIAGKMMMKLLEKPLKDHRAAIDSIMSKGLIYTIARPMGLKDKELELDYVETFEGVPSTSNSIPRASVAHFMLKAIEDKKYENTSVGLASAR